LSAPAQVAQHPARACVRVPPTLDRADIGPLIARSAKCEVFALGASAVVKFYPLGTTAHEVRRQIDLSHRVHGAGINAPWVAESPTRHGTDGRLGALYQRRQGRTITRMLHANPLALLPIARLLASEHRCLHARPGIDGLPSIRGRLQAHLVKDLHLAPPLKEALSSIVDDLPDGGSICHGDFCWDNLLVSADEVTVLDWADVGLGDPVYDVARTWVLLNFNDGTDSPLTRWICRMLSAAYLRAYRGGQAFDARRFADWRLVNAALRLRDLPERHHPRLLRFVERELAARGRIGR